MNEQVLLDSGYRKYAGNDIDIYYNKELCKHAAECVYGAPSVFEVGRVPWIEPSAAQPEHIQTVINRCPTGALKYKLKGADQVFPEHNGVIIRNLLYRLEDVRDTTQSFAAYANGDLAGEVTFVHEGGNLIIIAHTYVNNRYRGYGLARELIKFVVGLATRQKKKILPLCPFSRREFDNTSEYQALEYKEP